MPGVTSLVAVFDFPLNDTSLPRALITRLGHNPRALCEGTGESVHRYVYRYIHGTSGDSQYSDNATPRSDSVESTITNQISPLRYALGSPRCRNKRYRSTVYLPSATADARQEAKSLTVEIFSSHVTQLVSLS